MRTKRIISFLLAVMLFSCSAFVTAHAEDDLAKRYLGAVPVIQGDYDLSIHVPHMPSQGLRISQGALENGELARVDGEVAEYFSELKKDINFSQCMAFSADYQYLYFDSGISDADIYYIDKEGDPYAEIMEVWLDFNTEDPKNELVHFALTRGGFVKAAGNGNATLVQTNVKNADTHEQSFEGGASSVTTFRFKIDVSALNLQVGDKFGFYCKYTSTFYDDVLADLSDPFEEWTQAVVTSTAGREQLTTQDDQANYNYVTVGEYREWLAYELPSGGLMIDRYFGSDENVVVPSYLTKDGRAANADDPGAMQVKELGCHSVSYGVFQYNEHVKSIEIPDGITCNRAAFRTYYVERIAFQGTTTFGGAVKDNTTGELTDPSTEFGFMSLYQTYALKELIWPQGIKVLGRDFLRVTGLESVVIPEGVETIEIDALREARNLSDVTLPNTLKTIADNAFFRCEKLESIVLPASVETVGRTAFSYCYGLKSITVLNKDTELADDTFQGIGGITVYGIPGGKVQQTVERHKKDGWVFRCYEHDMQKVQTVAATLRTGDGYDVYRCTGCGYQENRANGDYWPNPFKDVKYHDPSGKTDSWFAEQVKYVYVNKLFEGMTDNTFEPNTVMSRAMFCRVLANISKVDVDKDKDKKVGQFTDVPANKWYTGAVAWAFQQGIVAGYNDGSFKPNASISRQEMCVMLATYADNVLDLYGYLSEVPDNGLLFADDAKIPSWSKKAITVMKNNGYITGIEENGLLYFRPTQTATRAQVATIIMLFCQANRLP